MTATLKYIATGFMFFCCCGVIAQRVSPADSALIFSLIEKADSCFIESNYSCALAFCEQARQKSVDQQYTTGEGYALIKTADILIEKGDYKTSAEFSARAFKTGAKIKDSLIMSISLLHTAQADMYTDKLDEAIATFDKALTLKLNKTKSTYAALAWNEMGYTYGLKGDLEKQADCYMTALRKYESIPDEQGMALVLSNLSSLFNQLNEKDKSIHYAKRAIAIREKLNDYYHLSISCCNLSQLYLKVDSVEVAKYQDLCVKYALLSNNIKRIAHSYVSASLVSFGQKKFQQSLDYELKAINLLEKNKIEDGFLASRYIMVGTLLAQTVTDSARPVSYFQKGIDLAKKLTDRFTLRDGYLHLAIFYKGRKDFYNAYENIKKHSQYKDTILQENTKADIAEIETKYQTEKKDQQIFQLNAAQKIRQLEIDKQKAVIAGNLLEAQQKQNEIELLSKSQELQQVKIQQQTEELEKQFLLAKNNQQQLKLAKQSKQLQQKQLQGEALLRNGMIGAIVVALLLAYVLFNRYQLSKKLQQQKELLAVRNSIAKDLHDDIGSTLTSIKILSQVSKNNIEKDKDKSAALLQKITDQSSEMEQGMSDIVWAIKPDNDKLENIVARMREYINHTLESKNITTNFNADDKVMSKSIGMQQRRDLFLVFKEAINNAAKYSKASKVVIDLSANNGNVSLSVKDDGVGFDQSVTNTSSNGLKNMAARAAALNGQFNIQSSPGNGTAIDFTMPAT